MKTPLDQTDWAILRELQADARISYAELGRRVGLSSPAVQERVRRLESAGVIKGYHADIDPEAVGLTVMAFVRVRQINGKHRQIMIELVQNTPEIINCYDVTGDDWFLMEVVAKSTRHLEDVLLKFLPYGQTITGIVMRAYVDNRPITQELIHPQHDP